VIRSAWTNIILALLLCGAVCFALVNVFDAPLYFGVGVGVLLFAHIRSEQRDL
jgi:hypothetical protein